MKKLIILIGLCLVLLFLPWAPAFCQLQKLAQTGMKFLSISPDARASALGDAFTAIEGNSSAMFYNPAGMAFANGFMNASLGQVTWIADINYAYGCVSFSPENGRFGVAGVSVLAADYGDFKGTIRNDSDQGFEDIGMFSPSAMSIGIGYANALSNKFSVGANVKYVIQDLGTSIVGFKEDGSRRTKSYLENVYAFDFGILYRTGFESLNFGMVIRNFSREVRYEDEGFQLPLTFKIGVSMNMLDLHPALNSELHSLLLSVDAVHPRDYPEQVYLGTEYLFMKTFALRVGYATPNDDHGLSAGIGLQQSYRNYLLALDYGYTPFEIFNDVHRFSVHFSF